MILFEAKENYHPLDYKFYKSRVVNLTEEYNCIHLSASSSFFRFSFIKDKKFKEGVFNGEDTRFINSLLLLNPLYGIIKEAIYFYRKRADSTSAVQNSEKIEEYYFSIFQLVNEFLIQKSIKLYNKIISFIQFYLAYNMLFRISFPTYKFLEKDKLNKYYETYEKILKQIEDKYILEQKILSLKEKFVALSKKYNRDLRNDIVIHNESIIYSGNLLTDIKKYRSILVWRILDIKNNNIHLEGKDNCFLKVNQFFYFCKLGNKIFYPEYHDYSGYDLITMYGIIDKGRIVIFDIPIENIEHQIIQFFLSYNGFEIEIFPSLGWFSHIPSLLNGYYSSGVYIMKIIDDRINVYLYNESLKESFENQYCKQLKKYKKTNLINFRNNYFKNKKITEKDKKEIWIINDGQNLAGDNGEYFFRYLKKIKPKKIDYYFAIKRDCSDYQRLKCLGNILELGSEYYLNIFLLTDKIISSVSDSWVDNPFGHERKYMRDLFNFKFIFIQHGILKDDLSEYLNRITKNFNLIIASSNKEYNSFLDWKYNYNFNNIILTGMPKYDNLKDLQKSTKIEKIIIIAPTWRKYIKGTFDSNTYESIYSCFFNLSNYFIFYNNLINNEQLLSNMKKLNYTGIFCLHPKFSKQWIDFKQNEIFSVIDVCDYQNLVLKSSILVTDYSSIFFDFAYMKKPIIYFHFDYKEYRKNHCSEGYFDYKRHGFGPVCVDLKCTIKEIISKIKTDCKLEKKYLKRIKGFFRYQDEKNCERLLLNLLNISEINLGENLKINIFIIIILLIVFLILFIFGFKKKY